MLAGPTLRIVVADSGAAALEMLQRERVDAALVDLHMPGMDGVTLARSLKNAPGGGGVPVWIMTAAPTSAAAEQARLSGAESLLKKPFDCGIFREDLLRRLAVGPAPGSVAA